MSEGELETHKEFLCIQGHKENIVCYTFFM